MKFYEMIAAGIIPTSLKSACAPDCLFSVFSSGLLTTPACGRDVLLTSSFPFFLKIMHVFYPKIVSLIIEA